MIDWLIYLSRFRVRLYISHFFYPCVFESGAPLEKESVQSAVHCVLQRSFETEKKVVRFCTEYFPIRFIRDKGKFVTLKLLSGQKTDQNRNYNSSNSALHYWTKRGWSIKLDPYIKSLYGKDVTFFNKFSSSSSSDNKNGSV